MRRRVEKPRRSYHSESADGQPTLLAYVVSDSHRADLVHDLLELIEEEAERLKYIPPYADEIAERAKRDLGR